MRIQYLTVMIGLVGAMLNCDARAQEVKLLGADLSGWTFELEDADAKMDDVWSVKDGVLICRGKPRGVLRTEKEFENYRLTLEWRWPAGTERGNSGVLVHSSTPRAIGIWPQSVEVQLGKDNAGDFWVIGTTLNVPNEESRKKNRRYLNLTDGSEKPAGEWNEMEITCRGNEITVRVNGTLVNRATNTSATKGAICLQSEGTEIHFRRIVVSSE